MSAVLDTTATRRQHVRMDDGSLILRTAHIKWTPWALPGTEFKLLDYDHNHSYVCFLLRIHEDAPASVHKHIGAANAYILDGGFSYEHGSVHEGDYMVEAGGVTHTPQIHPGGCTLLGFMHGCLQGFLPDGSTAGVVDVDWHIQAARQNGAFEHLEGVPRS
jgi:2,4'-dihydroxyacetophenone dioxygenase